MFSYTIHIVVTATIFLVFFPEGSKSKTKVVCDEACNSVNKYGCMTVRGEFVPKNTRGSCCNRCIPYIEKGQKCVGVTMNIKVTEEKTLHMARNCRPPASCNISIDECVSKKSDN